MNSVEYVRAICKDRKIPISKLERDLGFSNGYISQLKRGVFPADRASLIADYLHIDFEDLLSGGATKKPASGDAGDLAEYLEDLRERPETRALLEASRGMTKDQVDAMAELIKKMRGNPFAD